MKPLFTSWYCPNESNHKSTTTKDMISEVLDLVAKPRIYVTPITNTAPTPQTTYKPGTNLIFGWPVVDLFSANAFSCVKYACIGKGIVKSCMHKPNGRVELKAQCPICTFEWKVCE